MVRPSTVRHCTHAPGRIRLALEPLEPRVLLTAAPTGLDLQAAYDTGVSSTDNLTNLDNSAPAANLRFSVTGTILNATVSVYADGTLIGSATGVAGTTQVDTAGAYSLTDAVHSLTARQTVGGNE